MLGKFSQYNCGIYISVCGLINQTLVLVGILTGLADIYVLQEFTQGLNYEATGTRVLYNEMFTAVCKSINN